MATARAPKQWCLTKTETITSYESWRQNLQYTLSLDPNFAPFLVEGFTWLKKTAAAPLRGLADDGEDIPEASRRTAAQKSTHLELLLGQIANYCPIISRNTIVKNSVSICSIWQAIRLHFGFQTSGGHFIDINNIRQEPGERAEDLYQRLMSFIEDNLLRTDGSIRHHGELPETDEELSPSLENFIVLTWLRLIHPELPTLVKQRYGAELRSQTLASLKPEISSALDSLVDEIHSSADAKVLRTAFRDNIKIKDPRSKKTSKTCTLCKQAGRPYQHFLSKCKYLPEEDRSYMSKVRHTVPDDLPSESDDELPSVEDSEHVTYKFRSVASRRVTTKQSPVFKAFYKHHPVEVLLDTGAELSMIKASSAKRIGATVKKSNQSALQADGMTPLEVVGETRITLTRGGTDLYLEAIIVSDLDVDIIAGIPFMSSNDIAVRPSKQEIVMKDREIVSYGESKNNKRVGNRVRRTQAFVLRAKATTIWPGDFVELDTPTELEGDCVLAVEPRIDMSPPGTRNWPQPHILESVGRKIRLLNDTSEPQQLKKNDHVCQVILTNSPEITDKLPVEPNIKPKKLDHDSYHSDKVILDPDNILSSDCREKARQLLRDHDEVFSPDLSGYNGAVGPFEAVVNMGPVEPPQRKGRLPQYARNKLTELQTKFDELESKGVFKKPEDVGITVEYLNPSFLVKKPSGGHRLVTAFAEVGQYSKPQPSLMPDVDSTLRSIGQWKYLIVSDLTSAFYQIPLSRSSMKYCGVATPFRGVRVYTRCAMGMPGSETALEELMCRVLGDCLQDGCVAKLADDLYCGGNTPEELISNWARVLRSLHEANLHLSPAKTIICPRSTTILGWIWQDGQISASPHKIAVLSSCKPPENVKGLRSFIGAYKMLARVLPGCAKILSPLDAAVAGLDSKDTLRWTDELVECFMNAQQSLKSNRSITIPKASDQLWIVTDGSVTKHGIGATLYVTRSDKLMLAGFFSAKLRQHQVNWLPCEVEALCIAAAVKHFSPFIVQSEHQSCVLTDSKPCVQAVDKLRRGEFSASPRVTSFLSVVSRYQASVLHLAGKVNIPSDFASRNAANCDEPNCQVCTFIATLEDTVVRSVSVQNILDSNSKLPFTSRSAWKDIQTECPDMRRAVAHLKQGTRPSKKLTNIKDVKRYLNVASVAKDGLLVVRRVDPLLPPADLIVVSRNVLDGLLTALHIKLSHPTKHQLSMVFKRHFYALDLQKAVDKVFESCHACMSLKRFPDTLVQQSSEDPPECVGINFAADVLKRNRQLILVVRETVTSFSAACIIDDERRDTLREGLASLMVGLHPIDGPNAVVRVDAAPGFVSLKDDEALNDLHISLQIGRVKNVNKNPVAEKAILELESEILRYEPGGGPVTPLGLAICVARMNCRIRNQGLSSRELWTQRSQYTNEQLPISDKCVLQTQYEIRQQNHQFSEISKCANRSHKERFSVGELVYLYADKNKLRGRDRYIVVSTSGEWCTVKKFSGHQLRATSYQVKHSDCYRVDRDIRHTDVNPDTDDFSDNDNDADAETNQNSAEIPNVPSALTTPLATTTTDDHHEYVTVAQQDISNDSELIDMFNEPHGDQPPSECTPEAISGTETESRPRRMRKTPQYLSDYVLY